MNIYISGKSVWVFDRSSVKVQTTVDDIAVDVYVSVEALQDHFGGGTGNQAVNAYTANQGTINGVIEDIVRSGRAEPDGVYIVRSSDFE